MRAVSPKRAAQKRIYAKHRVPFLEQRPVCEFPGGCTERATTIQHLRGRRGARLLDEAWWAASCLGHNLACADRRRSVRPARVALALVATTAASVTVIATHHHRHPAASSATLAEVVPLSPRASRAHTREPLPPVKRGSASHRQGTSRSRSFLRVARPAGGNGILADVTMYCSTGNRNADGRWPELGDVAVMDRSIPFGTRVLIDGNVYTVRDWIGWGSDYDLYGGDQGCEQRALNFGRRHLRVVVER